jgi:hypothetical protein
MAAATSCACHDHHFEAPDCGADDRMPALKTATRWTEAVALHDAAVAEYAAAARVVARDTARWDAPLAEGKWSPAQITLHLIMAFEAVGRELDGGPAMALRTKAWHRLVLRFTLQRRLLRGGAFPVGARAPREARPPVPTENAASLIARFEQLAAELVARVSTLHAADPRARLTHPYFGALPLHETVYISARHVRHHRSQLPS